MKTLTKIAAALAIMSVAAACGGDDGEGGDTPLSCFSEADYFKSVTLNNSFGADPMLEDPANLNAPGFAPAAGSPVLTAGATPPEGFDTSATFVGAIGDTDWTLGWTAYPVDTTVPDTGSIIEITDNIKADTTWSSDNTYVLKGHIFVEAGTLTILPGTVVRGDSNSSLVITQEAKIEAVGTAENPIVMTSAKQTGAAAGDWGGLVLLGKAQLNVVGGSDNIEGFPANTVGSSFGGNDQEHDCGTLNYVRIEYGGFELSADNELNGLTVGGCGTQTDLDYIQIHRGADDGVEFFGGRAAIKHLVVTQTDDDSVDWDFGWDGVAQFVIIQQNAQVGNMGFESDNNKNNNDATPRSHPTIWNATMIGSFATVGTAGRRQGAMHLRRGTAGEMGNFIVTGFADFAIDVDGLSSRRRAEDGEIAVESSYFFANATDDGFPAGFDAADDGENDCVSEE
jgi:hypothetical protein